MTVANIYLYLTCVITCYIVTTHTLLYQVGRLTYL